MRAFHIFIAAFIIVQSLVIYRQGAHNYVDLSRRIDRHDALANCATCRRRRTTTEPPFDMFLHEDRRTDQMEASIANDGQYYERAKTRLFTDAFRWMHGRQAFWDVGANVGWYTLLALSHGAPVVAFEAMQYNLRTLNASVAANAHFAARLVAWHVAVTDGADAEPLCVVPVNGDRDAWATNYGNGHTTREPLDDRGCAETTRQASIDALSSGGGGNVAMSPLMHVPIYLMKMDCEGCEVRALHGAARLLADDAQRPCAIVAEYLHDPTMNPPEHASIVGWMNAMGYDASDFSRATFNATLRPPLRPGPTITPDAAFDDVGELLYVWREAADRCRG